ncbi:MAG: ABC transporter substrate-binding protein [Oscillospiraceae bacterium]|nr:ABC transporter substrate-binding protein [Oscillospiraceae bacterium]
MKKARAAVCVLLALFMLLGLAACAKDQGGSDKDSGQKTDQGGSSGQSDKPDQSGTERTGTDTSESDRSKDIPNLIIVSMEEYEAKPKKLQEGTSIDLITFSDVPSQVPWNCTPENWLHENIYEGLLYTYLGNPKDIRGCIAESWDHSDDYLTWTFKIRDGVKYSDGNECNAESIARGWDFIAEAAPANIGNYNVKSWEADGNNFIVHMTAPCPYFEVAMCGNAFYAVSPYALEQYGINDNRAAIGTAPYYIAEYTAGVGFVFKANPYYYLEEKMPCIETVNYHIIKDNNTLVMALMNGEANGANVRGVENYYNLMENNYNGHVVQSYGDVGPLWFNASKVEEFKIWEVRKAMCRFINYNAINDLIYDGLGIVQTSLWATNSSGWVPTDQFYYDPDEGHELLASVGLQASDIHFDATTADSGKSSFEAIQNELRTAGVTMEVQVIESEANFTYLMNGDWTLTVGSVGFRDNTPYLPWTFILKPDALIKQCWQDVYDPELYQKMLDEFELMTTATTWDEMLVHCKQITKYEQDDFGAIGGMQGPAFVAIDYNYKNPIYYNESHSLQLYYLYV